MAGLAQGMAQAELGENKEVPRVPVRRVASVPVICWKYFPRTQWTTWLQGMQLQLDHPKEKACKGVPGFSLCRPPQSSHSCARAVLGCCQAPLCQGWLPGASPVLWGCHGVPPYLFSSPSQLSPVHKQKFFGAGR